MVVFPPPPPFRWLLDTRTTTLEDFPTILSLLSLLPPATRTSILKHHSSTQLTALASALLQRRAIAYATPLPWSLAYPSTTPTHKPTSPALHYNVSHQAGLLVLAGIPHLPTAPAPHIGIDIVCTTEHNDSLDIAAAGSFGAWLERFRQVFSDADMATVLAAADPRTFYAVWAVREAYFKMRGDALLAADLRAVHVRHLRAPAEAEPAVWGEVVSGVQVWKEGERESVEVEVQAWGTGFVVATVVAERGWGMPAWREVSLEYDVLPFAETAWDIERSGDCWRPDSSLIV